MLIDREFLVRNPRMRRIEVQFGWGVVTLKAVNQVLSRRGHSRRPGAQVRQPSRQRLLELGSRNRPRSLKLDLRLLQCEHFPVPSSQAPGAPRLRYDFRHHPDDVPGIKVLRRFAAGTAYRIKELCINAYRQLRPPPRSVGPLI